VALPGSLRPPDHVAAASIFRRISSPLLQVGDLVFDCEVAVQRGGRTQFTSERIGAEVEISTHSYSLAKEYVVDGAVSGIAQFQNAGRPGFDALGNLASLSLGALEELTGLNFSTRVQDFEAALEAARESREEFELISKVIGRKRVVILDWSANTTAEDGDSASYRLNLREVLRAGLTIADAVEAALALNGSGGAVNGGGASTVTPGSLDVVP